MVIFSRAGRHCDERCYNAMWSGCSCICGGKNHGKGLGHAINHNTLSGKSLVELATDELRQDAFKIHGTKSGRFDPTKVNTSAIAKTFERNFGAKNN